MRKFQMSRTWWKWPQIQLNPSASTQIHGMGSADSGCGSRAGKLTRWTTNTVNGNFVCSPFETKIDFLKTGTQWVFRCCVIYVRIKVNSILTHQQFQFFYVSRSNEQTTATYLFHPNICCHNLIFQILKWNEPTISTYNVKMRFLRSIRTDVDWDEWKSEEILFKWNL